MLKGPSPQQKNIQTPPLDPIWTIFSPARIPPPPPRARKPVMIYAKDVSVESSNFKYLDVAPFLIDFHPQAAVLQESRQDVEDQPAAEEIDVDERRQTDQEAHAVAEIQSMKPC